MATEELLSPSTDQRVEQRAREVMQRLAESFADIKRRNEALLFLHMPSRVGGLARTVKDVQVRIVWLLSTSQLIMPQH